jgi:ribosomal protein S18 acetylase RimI-like enzyme
LIRAFAGCPSGFQSVNKEQVRIEMGSQCVLVRRATPADAEQAGYLLYLSGPAPSEAIWGGPANNAIRVWRELFPIPHHIYSYSHAFVAQREDQGAAGSSPEIAGLLLGIDSRSWITAQRAMGREIRFKWFTILRPWQFPRLIGAILHMAGTFDPLAEGDYSIQALAVLPKSRRQGVATRLLESAASFAREKGMQRIVLDVLIDNEGARRFYEQAGFREVKRITDPGFCRWFGVAGSLRVAKDIV